MMKRISKLGWITVAVVIFLILIGMGNLTKSDPKQVANQLQRQTEIQPKERIPSKYDAIQLFLETKDTGGKHLSIETPVTESDAINDDIKQWIEKQKTTFLEVANEDDIEEEQPSFHLTLKTTKITDSYYQIQFTKNETAKSTHTSIFNIDIENDRILNPDDVLKMDDSTLKTISELAKKNNDTDIPDEQLEEAGTHPESWNWSINNDMFTLYMDVEDAENPTTIDIPLDSLYLHVNEDITEIIDMSDEQQQEMEDAIQEEKERIAYEKKKKEEQAAKEKAKQEERNKEVNDPNGKYIALTFDDGPSADVTPRVLDTLAEHGAVATFFMLGSEVDTNPDIAERVANEGHEIGNHTEDHQDLTTLGPDTIRSEINHTSDKIKQATGTNPYLVRAPYGAYNDTVLQTIANGGDSLALWSVDSLDWQSRNANAIHHEVTQNSTSGSIVLMHDIHPTTADALPDLLTTLEKQGYQFVTVSQLMEIQGLSGVGPHYGYRKE